MHGSRNLFVLPCLLVVLVAWSTPSPAAGVCGDVPPASGAIARGARSITAGDALAVLQAAVGIRPCEKCICDVNDSGSITSGDALAVLRKAVGQAIVLACPSCTAGPDADALATAVCESRQRCEPALYDFRNETFEDCVAGQQAAFAHNFESIDAAIAAGRVEFLPEVFASCLDAYDSYDCELGVDPGACDYLKGKQGQDHPCSLTTECGDGLYCAGPPSPSCGSCQPRTAVGADCSDSVCVEGSSCLAVQQSARCIANNLAEGATCGTVETGLCRGRLQCVGSGPETCTRPAGPGEDCDATLGEAAGCNIYQSSFCVSGKCVAGSFNATGGSCVGANACDIDNTCSSATNTCAALPTAGQACNFGSCASGFYCGANSKCAAVASEGGACTADAGCESSLYCLGPQGSRTCQPYPYTSCP